MVFFVLLKQLLATKDKDKKELKRGKKKSSSIFDINLDLSSGDDTTSSFVTRRSLKEKYKYRKHSPIDDIKLPEPIAIPEWKGDK